MRIIMAAAIDAVLAAVHGVLVLEGRVFRAVGAEHGELQPRAHFEPGARRQYLDINRHDPAWHEFLDLLMGVIRPRRSALFRIERAMRDAQPALGDGIFLIAVIAAEEDLLALPASRGEFAQHDEEIEIIAFRGADP